MLLGLFVKMANGATYSVAPFLNREALGSVTGIVGAGGNVGAVLAGFLFKTSAISWPTAMFLLGLIVTCASFVVLTVPFSEESVADDAAIPVRHGGLNLGPAAAQA
jgi:NNP family nitrate/nitrite transporter-like MFS transporter